MSRIWWIPDWVGDWADRHPFFRNFPPFAALSFILFFAVTFYQVDRRGDLSRNASVLAASHFQWRRALLCFGAVALLGTSLEFLQQLVPERKEYAHPWQIMWSVAGALVGAFGAAVLMRLLCASDKAGLATDTKKDDRPSLLREHDPDC